METNTSSLRWHWAVVQKHGIVSRLQQPTLIKYSVAVFNLQQFQIVESPLAFLHLLDQSFSLLGWILVYADRGGQLPSFGA